MKLPQVRLRQDLVTSGKSSKGSGRERNSRRDVCPETDGREETGGTGHYGSGVRRPGESF